MSIHQPISFGDHTLPAYLAGGKSAGTQHGGYLSDRLLVTIPRSGKMIFVGRQKERSRNVGVCLAAKGGEADLDGTPVNWPRLVLEMIPHMSDRPCRSADAYNFSLKHHGYRYAPSSREGYGYDVTQGQSPHSFSRARAILEPSHVPCLVGRETPKGVVATTSEVQG